MLLTYQALEQSIQTLAHITSGGEGPRLKPRASLRGSVAVWARGAGPVKKTLVSLRDISVTGLGFFDRTRFKLNSILLIALPLEDGSNMFMPAKIVHVKDSADGIFSYGSRFARELDLTNPTEFKLKPQLQFEAPDSDAEIERIRKAMFDA